MEEKKIDFKTAKNNCEWNIARARELRALFVFDSEPMVARNKVRALSAIDTMQTSLEELKQYIESLGV